MQFILNTMDDYMSTVELDFKVADIIKKFKAKKMTFDPKLTYLFDLQHIAYREIETCIKELENPLINDEYKYNMKMKIFAQYDQIENIKRVIAERIKELNSGTPFPQPKTHIRKLNIDGIT